MVKSTVLLIKNHLLFVETITKLIQGSDSTLILLWNKMLVDLSPNSNKGSVKAELKKVGSTGSTLPEHSRFSPGKHKARNYLKDVLIVFQDICSVKIA